MGLNQNVLHCEIARLALHPLPVSLLKVEEKDKRRAREPRV
jgi:hypothetical protein